MWGAPRSFRGRSLTICGCDEKPKEHPPEVKPPPAPASETYGGHKGAERPERPRKAKPPKPQTTFRGDSAHDSEGKARDE